jgi:hypothetical protein
MSNHTYSVIRTNDYDWTGNPDDVYYVRCNCGIESGMSHASIESAHREPKHYYAPNSRRRIGPATFDGRIIDTTSKV